MPISDKDVVNFLFRLKDIQQQEEWIKTEQASLGQAQGVQQVILAGQLESSKQTLEVIKLTRAVFWLTVVLVILGLAQLAVMIWHPSLG
ncbi:hypothetical protein HY095_00785 [Candidatus Micrarchaeota archaeon]|nr:hypothetical protein [Candidatus Micrarchaeota archaeon]